jgi:hypothetical protein
MFDIKHSGDSRGGNGKFVPGDDGAAPITTSMSTPSTFAFFKSHPISNS